MFEREREYTTAGSEKRVRKENISLFPKNEQSAIKWDTEMRPSCSMSVCLSACLLLP